MVTSDLAHCEERERLERALAEARGEWYRRRDVIDKRREYEKAEKRVRNLHHNLRADGRLRLISIAAMAKDMIARMAKAIVEGYR